MIARFFRLIVLVLLPSVSCVAVVQAASFDCDKATTETEIAICADPELSAFDEVMSAVWKLETRTAADMSAQRQWLAQRDMCTSNTKCLKGAMLNRLKSKMFGLGDFELVELYDFLEQKEKFYLVQVLYYAYNSEISISAISPSKLSSLKWRSPQFDEDLSTCNLQSFSDVDVLRLEETSVVGWVSVIDQGYADNELDTGEVSVFTKWIGHGDLSSEIIYRLIGEVFVPSRGKVDNCSDQQKKYVQVSFE